MISSTQVSDLSCPKKCCLSFFAVHLSFMTLAISANGSALAQWRATSQGLLGSIPDRKEDSKGLPDLIIKAPILEGLNEDGVDLPQYSQTIWLRHISQHPHSQARTCVMTPA